MITIGTDFSGIGSPEQALIKLGIKHKSMFACDVDKYAKQSYLANYNSETFYDDITKRNHNEAPYVDLYVAGFPCQTFSMAGKRKGFEDTRGTLFFDLLKYLKAKKPKYFVLENVKGLLSHNGGRTFLTILDCLAKTVNRQYSFSTYEDGLNYHIYYKVLNTKDFGIPQNRERVFIVGFREEKHSFKFPKKMPLELKLKDMLQDNPDSKYFVRH
jgi:DNA (cytosine-5)-methyltransferase 1